MKIIYYDGSILRCRSLYFTEKEVIADDIYIIPIAKILMVETELNGGNLEITIYLD